MWQVGRSPPSEAAAIPALTQKKEHTASEAFVRHRVSLKGRRYFRGVADAAMRHGAAQKRRRRRGSTASHPRAPSRSSEHAVQILPVRRFETKGRCGAAAAR
ncbi:hypothetical protein MTO96_022930 [Rhipicephalus appendiculatus]